MKVYKKELYKELLFMKFHIHVQFILELLIIMFTDIHTNQFTLVVKKIL